MIWSILLAVLGGSTGAAIVTGVFEIIKRKSSKEDSQTKALRFLMYDRIRHLCETYIKREYITTTELKILTDMHQCYHDDLSGNGFLDGLMNEVHDKCEIHVA